MGFDPVAFPEPTPDLRHRGVSKHHEWLGKHAQLISRPTEEFGRLNRTKYGLPLRSVCAQHSRLWNRNIVDQPKLPSGNEVPWVASFVSDTQAQARGFLLQKCASPAVRHQPALRSGPTE